MGAKADKHHDAVVKRVSRKEDHEGHNSSWKVAFADFCLALMCLFLVLWVLAARDKEELEQIVREAGGSVLNEGRGNKPEQMGGPRGSLISREPLPAYGETLAARKTPDLTAPVKPGERLAKTNYENPADMQELARMIAQLSEKVGLAANLQTIITPYGLRVMVHDTDGQGMFERGNAKPSGHFSNLLREMGPLFAQIENQMLIVGHTDSFQYAGGEYSAYTNWTLSTDRALTARAQLLAGGMPPTSVLQVVGMAERAPYKADETRAAVNRRIELLILTPGQSRAITNMFGMPDETVPLIDGVESALPDRDALSWLRNQLRTAVFGDKQ